MEKKLLWNLIYGKNQEIKKYFKVEAEDEA